MVKYATYADEQLIELLKSDDESAFTEIYNRHWEGLLAYAIDILNDNQLGIEVVHDVFLAVWTRRTDIQINISFKSYLYKSVRNGCLKSIGRRRKTAFETLPEVADHASLTHNNKLELQELHSQLEQVVSSLPSKMRQVYQLREEDYSHRQIGNFLGISEETSRKHLKKALKILKSKFAHLFFSLLISIHW